MTSVVPKILGELQQGNTVTAVAAKCDTSVVFVKTMLDHFNRLGLLADATSLCSSGLGACHTTEPLGQQARIQCAGCALAG
ncbi:MAG: hypothetical protein ACTH1Z_05920 [Ancrocorticia sp.]|uniref:hypothetical protein n=1 Tax=Ancrocorticia sp. TaxID=2593684 RepID=UPI003F8DC68E